MTDMLVKLYDLPELQPALERCRAAGITIRRALAAERQHVIPWIRATFSEGWASECEAAFAQMPIACWLAVEGDHPVGFACYDAGWRGMFGPTGVDETTRGKGVGAALLLACLHTMSSLGYVYAVIGWTGPQDFYAKVCGATPIPGSRPGGFRGILGVPPDVAAREE